MSRLRDLSILVVDDEVCTLNLMSEVLKEEFDSVITAKNGDEGLKKFKKYSPDVVLADVAMPIMDGLDMAHEIKSLNRQTPVIMISAHSEKEMLLGAIDANVDKYIIKPVDMDDMIELLKKLVNRALPVRDVVELCEGLSFDRARKCLLKDGLPLSLSKRESSFVALLVANLGMVVDMELIKKRIWQNSEINNTAVRTFIKRIRDKAGINFIKNVPTVGYKIEKFIS
ncbi:response regulator transcription factor [Campylobacter sp. 19-13652]|uniref:response regulator transcription factor n=1 Tax=Campylobacter sp. 19-13652 TaxID=2840180 RepID=UPI001C76A1D7|nr:response regulator transcription factor [Campylobacter sp. 19-13652]BCX80097.1 CheY-P-specific phosphatase CheX [Campylobacter sp. 19-13652]